MLARILAGDYPLDLTGTLCDYATELDFVPPGSPLDDNNDVPEEPSALETDSLILFVGIGIAAAVLLLVVVVKRKVVASIITRAGQRGAGQPKGECVRRSQSIWQYINMDPIHNFKTTRNYTTGGAIVVDATTLAGAGATSAPPTASIAAGAVAVATPPTMAAATPSTSEANAAVALVAPPPSTTGVNIDV